MRKSRLVVHQRLRPPRRRWAAACRARRAGIGDGEVHVLRQRDGVEAGDVAGQGLPAARASMRSTKSSGISRWWLKLCESSTRLPRPRRRASCAGGGEQALPAIGEVDDRVHQLDAQLEAHRRRPRRPARSNTAFSMRSEARTTPSR